MSDIEQALIGTQGAVRLGTAVAAFAALAVLEVARPWRTAPSRVGRWPGNLALMVLGVVVARIAAPFAPVTVAVAANNNGWGLFNWMYLSAPIAAIVGFLVLDLVIYTQHRAFHVIPQLWPIHRVHHVDTAFDVTTGVRFHPIEILLSLLVKCGAVLAFGPSVATVIAFEIALNAASLFNHANVQLPARADRLLRWLVVTPTMHRVHHSIERHETDSNFGFFVPWWDRLFGTYVADPAAGPDGLTIGLPDFRSESERGIGPLLSQPFRQPD